MTIPSFFLYRIIKCKWTVIHADAFFSFDITLFSYSLSCNLKRFKSLVLTLQNLFSATSLFKYSCLEASLLAIWRNSLLHPVFPSLFLYPKGLVCNIIVSLCPPQSRRDFTLAVDLVCGTQKSVLKGIPSFPQCYNPVVPLLSHQIFQLVSLNLWPYKGSLNF